MDTNGLFLPSRPLRQPSGAPHELVLLRLTSPITTRMRVMRSARHNRKLGERDECELFASRNPGDLRWLQHRSGPDWESPGIFAGSGRELHPDRSEAEQYGVF